MSRAVATKCFTTNWCGVDVGTSLLQLTEGGDNWPEMSCWSVGNLVGEDRGLRFAHLSICSSRTKVTELCLVLHENIEELAAQDYGIVRLDRDENGRGTAFYIQDNIPGKNEERSEYKGVKAL